MTKFPAAWSSLDLPMRREVEERLRDDESVETWFTPDLDSDLRFADGLVVLTDQRVISVAARSDDTSHDDDHTSPQFLSWPLEQVEGLRCRDRAGVGVLELLGPASRLGAWRYTLRQAAAAKRLVECFEQPDEADSEDPAAEARPESAPIAPARISSLLRLFHFARPYAGLVLLGFALTLATTAAGLVPPYLTAPLVDEILVPFQNKLEPLSSLEGAAKVSALQAIQQTHGSRFWTIGWYLLGLGGAAALSWVLAWGQGVVMAWVSERIGANLRNSTFAHMQKLSLDYFGRKRTGDLISRVSSDTDRVCTFLSDNLVDFATDFLMVVGTAGVLLFLDPILAAAALLPFPIVAWLVYRVRGQLSNGFSRGGRAWAEMTNVLADVIPGIRVVKAFAQERREVERFRRANDQIVSANDRVNTVWAMFWPLVILLNQLGLLAVWAVGGWRVYEGQITVGVLTAFIAYISRFYVRMESMTRIVGVTQRAAAAAQRVFEVLDRKPSVPEPTEPVPVGKLRGTIEFANVTFRYGHRTVLDNFSFEIQPGEMIGLVGASGAGKSTLANLVCRFYDPVEGLIRVDGTDIRQFPVEEFRRHIGVVLQEPFLFYGTIAENIAYGRPQASRDDIVAAARAARAHEFILRLADGYDTLIGERGQSLSGGERQRISIARALLIDPAILILDEATSAVDTQTELEIQEALDNLVRGRTTIAIAHRLSTLRKADRLVVLERGRIAEVGTPQSLLDRPGVYARLVQAQMELAQASAD